MTEVIDEIELAEFEIADIAVLISDEEIPVQAVAIAKFNLILLSLTLLAPLEISPKTVFRESKPLLI